METIHVSNIDVGKKKISIRHVDAGKILLYGFLLIASLIFIYPLIYTLITSLKMNNEIFTNYFGLPHVFQWENYKNAWVKGKIGTYFFNSLFLCGTYVAFGLLFSTMAAFVLGRLKGRWLAFIFFFFVAGMMIPIHAVLIPLAQIYVSLQMNSYLFLISIYIAGGVPYMIFVITGFMKSLPAELEEAAIMDGAGLGTIYYRVILPLAKPAISTMAILGFLSSWNDLILAMLFIKKEAMRTLSLGLMNFSGFFTTDYAGLCAAIIIVNIPTIIIYVLLQEYVEKGLTSGAVKG